MESSNLVVEFLLKNGANPDGCVEPVGVYTPFVEAVATENIPAATMLFEYGATVDKDRILSLMVNETNVDWTDLLRRMNITRGRIHVSQQIDHFINIKWLIRKSPQ